MVGLRALALLLRSGTRLHRRYSTTHQGITSDIYDCVSQLVNGDPTSDWDILSGQESQREVYVIMMH